MGGNINYLFEFENNGRCNLRILYNIQKDASAQEKFLEMWGSLGSFTYRYLNMYVRVHIYMCYKKIDVGLQRVKCTAGGYTYTIFVPVKT